MTKDDPVLEVLKGARDLLKASGWERSGTFAVDILGNSCLPESPDAVAYCAIGAIRAAASLLSGCFGVENIISDLVYEAEWALEKQVTGRFSRSAVHYNDRVAKDRNDVLALFDKVIEERTRG